MVQRQKYEKNFSAGMGTLFLTLCLVCMCLAGCGGSRDSESGGDTQSVQPGMEDLKNAMLGADTTLPEMVTVTSGDDNADAGFSFLSDLDYSSVDSYFYAYAKDGTAEEIAVVKMKDKGDVAEMMNSLHDHADQRKGTFAEYSPDQVELVEHAVITREGSYAALIISQKNGLVQNAFQDCFP